MKLKIICYLFGGKMLQDVFSGKVFFQDKNNVLHEITGYKTIFNKEKTCFYCQANFGTFTAYTEKILYNYSNMQWNIGDYCMYCIPGNTINTILKYAVWQLEKPEFK